MVRTTAVKTIRFIDLVLHRSTFGAVIHSYRMAASVHRRLLCHAGQHHDSQRKNQQGKQSPEIIFGNARKNAATNQCADGDTHSHDSDRSSQSVNGFWTGKEIDRHARAVHNQRDRRRSRDKSFGFKIETKHSRRADATLVADKSPQANRRARRQATLSSCRSAFS